MIRLTMEIENADSVIKEFTDPQEAATWFAEASDFLSGSVTKATWENVRPCDHIWSVLDSDEDSFLFRCAYGCAAMATITHQKITENAAISQV